jgi:hypothetical protein
LRTQGLAAGPEERFDGDERGLGRAFKASRVGPGFAAAVGIFLQ